MDTEQILPLTIYPFAITDTTLKYNMNLNPDKVTMESILKSILDAVNKKPQGGFLVTRDSSDLIWKEAFQHLL